MAILKEELLKYMDQKVLVKLQLHYTLLQKHKKTVALLHLLMLSMH
ncbi:Uncharacterised protein [Mycobacteroides abscessus]|nr:Uncharacterised protein [Mycobacteroides abscessus]